MPDDVEADREEGGPVVDRLARPHVGRDPRMPGGSEDEVHDAVLGIEDDGEVEFLK